MTVPFDALPAVAFGVFTRNEIPDMPSKREASYFWRLRPVPASIRLAARNKRHLLPRPI